MKYEGSALNCCIRLVMSSFKWLVFVNHSLLSSVVIFFFHLHIHILCSFPLPFINSWVLLGIGVLYLIQRSTHGRLLTILFKILLHLISSTPYVILLDLSLLINIFPCFIWNVELCFRYYSFFPLYSGWLVLLVQTCIFTPNTIDNSCQIIIQHSKA